MQSSSRRIVIVVLLLLAAVAAFLFAVMLGNGLRETTGGGEARMGDAFEALFVTAGLWIVLAVMLVIGGAAGGMPRWAALLAVILVPASAVAAFAGLDMASRHMHWAVVFPGVLAPLIAFYAFWAGWPRLHAALPAERTSVAVWAAIFLLSAVTFALAA